MFPACSACRVNPALYARIDERRAFLCGSALCTEALVFSAAVAAAPVVKKPSTIPPVSLETGFDSDPEVPPTPPSPRDVPGPAEGDQTTFTKEAQARVGSFIPSILTTLRTRAQTVRGQSPNPTTNQTENIFWSVETHMREAAWKFVDVDMRPILVQMDYLTSGVTATSATRAATVGVTNMDRMRLWIDLAVSNSIVRIARILVQACRHIQWEVYKQAKRTIGQFQKSIAKHLVDVLNSLLDPPAAAAAAGSSLQVESKTQTKTKWRTAETITLSVQTIWIPDPHDPNSQQSIRLALIQLIWVAFFHMALELVSTSKVVRDKAAGLAAAMPDAARPFEDVVVPKLTRSLRFFRDMYVGPSTIGIKWPSRQTDVWGERNPEKSAGLGAFTYRILSNRRRSSPQPLPEDAQRPFRILTEQGTEDYNTVLGIYDYDPVNSVGITTFDCVQDRAAVFRPNENLPLPPARSFKKITVLDHMYYAGTDEDNRYWIKIPDEQRRKQRVPVAAGSQSRKNQTTTYVDVISMVHVRDGNGHWWEGNVRMKAAAAAAAAKAKPPWIWLLEPEYTIELVKTGVTRPTVYVIDPTVYISIPTESGIPAAADVASSSSKKFDALPDLQIVNENYMRTPWMQYIQEPVVPTREQLAQQSTELRGGRFRALEVGPAPYVANCFFQYIFPGDVQTLRQSSELSTLRYMAHALSPVHCGDGTLKADILDSGNPAADESVSHRTRLGHGYTKAGMVVCCLGHGDEAEKVHPGMELFTTYSLKSGPLASLRHGYCRGESCVLLQGGGGGGGLSQLSEAALLSQLSEAEQASQIADPRNPSEEDLDRVMRPCINAP